MRESEYQSMLIRNLRYRFSGCLILKNDSSYLQGIPDLTILYRDRWAMLEVKQSESSPLTANQEYYIDLLNQMSFAAVIYPENEEEVLDALQQTFDPSWSARIFRR